MSSADSEAADAPARSLISVKGSEWKNKSLVFAKTIAAPLVVSRSQNKENGANKLG